MYRSLHPYDVITEMDRLQREIQQARFRRVVTLSNDVDPNGVEAQFRDGRKVA